jgi:transcriptional regulator with XRE-family HTH domain
MQPLTLRVGGDELRERRTTVGLSQERLAQLAECSTASVALFERGYRPGQSAVLSRIEAVLDAAQRDRDAP